ncbi:MAG: hypothetical protein V4670_07020 [Bacteroidota bacterium]
MNKISYYLVLIVGIITCLGFFPHAFLGMQGVFDHIAKGEIQEPAANGMQMIWLYSSIMMLVSGVWLITSANHIHIGSHVARLQILILGIGLTVFGLGCTYILGKVDAMFVFTIEGMILIVATTFFYKKAHHLYEHEN